MRLLFPTLLMLLLPLVTADNEFNVTLTNRDRTVYTKNQSVNITAHVEYQNVPVAGATIVFYVYDPNGNLAGQTNPNLTDANGEMTLTYTFVSGDKKGTWRAEAFVEQGALNGIGMVTFELVSH